MTTWYYLINGQQTGPVDQARFGMLIQSGAVRPDTMVWQEGMPNWVQAGSVPGLFAAGPAPLAYATAPINPGAPVAPAYINAPPPDNGPFLKIASAFTVNKARWSGPAVASPSAFYLLKVGRQQTGAGYGGGLVGILLANALSKDDPMRTCDLNDLAPNVRAALDPKGKRTGGDVIILPKDAMHLVKTSGFSGSVTAHIGVEKFPITCGMFGVKKARTFLNEQGWTLDYPVQPTAAPIHGKSYGLDPTTAARRGPSLMARIGYVLLALLILAAVIALRIATDK
jgi:hypothetical protein